MRKRLALASLAIAAGLAVAAGIRRRAATERPLEAGYFIDPDDFPKYATGVDWGTDGWSAYAVFEKLKDGSYLLVEHGKLKG